MCAVCDVMARASLPLYDPKITPNPNGLPIIGALEKLVGTGQAIALLVCILAVAGGGVAWGLGSLASSSRAATGGKWAVVGGAVGALIVVSASAIVSWMSGLA